MNSDKTACENMRQFCRPRFDPNWSESDEMECQKIVREWSISKNKTTSLFKESRQSLRRQIRKKGIAWGQSIKF